MTTLARSSRRRIDSDRPSVLRWQRGSTLIVAVVLLLVVSLVGLFALNVGISEQRSSASDFRSRITRQVAESALSHSFEYMRMSGLIPTELQGEVDLTQWEPCGATDTSFPCAAIDASRRGSAYRFRGGVDLDGNGTIDSLELYLMPMPNVAGTTESQAVSQVGAYEVQYGVGAVLCTLDASRNCTTVDDERSGLSTVTLVAIAQIPGESVRTTVSQSYGSFNILSLPPSAPPLVSGGIMQGVGNSTIVGNPDSGGPGVGVSIWTRGAMDVNNGSWQTCELDEYMRSGGTPSVSSSGVIVCPDCDCLTGDFLSGRRTGDSFIGIDLQTPRVTGEANDDDEYWAGPDGTFGTSDDTIPSQYFPCDLFNYVFGVSARANTNGADTNGDGIADAEAGLPYGICEDGVDLVGGAGGTPDGRIDAIDQYMESIEAVELADCSTLNAASTGVFWVTASQCALGGQVGTPEEPVVILGEKGFKLTNATVFGVLVGVDAALIDINEGALEDLTPEFESGGGKSRVYGAMIIEGGGKVNANIDLVSAPKVIQNINNDERSRRFGVVPGSWTDRFSF